MIGSKVQGSLGDYPQYRNTFVAALDISKRFGFRVMLNSIVIAFMRDAPFSLVVINL
jgi:hypothetical protein